MRSCKISNSFLDLRLVTFSNARDTHNQSDTHSLDAARSNSNREDSPVAKLTEDKCIQRDVTKFALLPRIICVKTKRGSFVELGQVARQQFHGRRVLTCLNRPSILNEETSYQSSIHAGLVAIQRRAKVIVLPER